MKRARRRRSALRIPVHVRGPQSIHDFESFSLGAHHFVFLIRNPLTKISKKGALLLGELKISIGVVPSCSLSGFRYFPAAVAKVYIVTVRAIFIHSFL